MSEIKDNRIPLEIGGKTYMIMLSLNLIDTFQDKYESLENLVEEFKNTQALKWIIAQFINESVDNHNDENSDKWQYVDEKWVGRKLSIFEDMIMVRDTLLKAFKMSMPIPNDEENFDPNLKATAH